MKASRRARLRSRRIWVSAVAVILAAGVYAGLHGSRDLPGGQNLGRQTAAGNLSPALDPAAYSPQNQIYPDPSQATADVANALKEAKREKKRVILDFGGNWCPDCHVLDIYFHNSVNLPILKRYFILVPVNVGQYDRNLDLAAKYNVPLQKGVPALVVLDSNGRLLYTQRNGQFEAMRRLEPAAVTRFLEKWKQ